MAESAMSFSYFLVVLILAAVREGVLARSVPALKSDDNLHLLHGRHELTKKHIPVEFSSAVDSHLLEAVEAEIVEGDIIMTRSLRGLLRQAELDSANKNIDDDDYPMTEDDRSASSSGNDQESLHAAAPARSKRGLVSDTGLFSLKWPNGEVPYVFQDEEIWKQHGREHYEKSRRAITKAMEIIHRKSCARFVLLSEYRKKVGQSSHARNYIKFMPATHQHRSCATMVGRQLGITPVFIGPQCYDQIGSVLHELLHVLGFYHEQSRPDRDQYVTVQPQNIDNYERNKIHFMKYSRGQIDSLGQPYDFDSIMHYSGNQFSKQPGVLKTIVANHDVTRRLGQRDEMTENDVRQLNMLYNCPPRTDLCQDAAMRPLEYNQMVSFQYKPRKWLFCSGNECRRKACPWLSDSDCSGEPQGCGMGKFKLLPELDDITVDKVFHGDVVRLSNALDYYPGKTLQCQPHLCYFGTCANPSEQNCSTNTFTIKKRPRPTVQVGQRIYGTDQVSLCQPDPNSADHEQCLACRADGAISASNCEPVRCSRDENSNDCLHRGIYYNARQWQWATSS